MKYLILLFSLFSLLPGCKSETEKQRPNIILFLVDDLGWEDTGLPLWTDTVTQNRIYQTPNVVKLAGQGMRFTQAYATPVCSPTRISLMTGMNAARHRVTNWTLIKDKRQPMETNHETLDFPMWNVNGMSQDSSVKNAVYATPLAQILRQSGYHTLHAGKAHLGAIGTPGENPLNLGFDVNIAGHAAGAPASYYGLDNFGNTKENESKPWVVPGLEKYHGQDIFLTEALTLEAIDALDKTLESGNPFFLYMAYYTVHTPIMADERFFQKYLDVGLDTIEARYASMISAMDKSIGDFMNYLDQKELSDQTIILFMSDNGGLSAVARGGTPHTHNYPLASGKGSIYEGGIREPMIVKWPGVIEENFVNNDYLIIEDFYPSILEMAGIENYKTIQKTDGQSFVSMLNGIPASKERALFWHYPNSWGPTGPGIGAFSAVRLGDWKLIYYHNDETFELFNIKEDISESTNRVSENPEIVKQLAEVLTKHLKDTDAQLPSHKETGKKVRYPNEKSGKL